MQTTHSEKQRLCRFWREPLYKYQVETLLAFVLGGGHHCFKNWLDFLLISSWKGSQQPHHLYILECHLLAPSLIRAHLSFACMFTYLYVHVGRHVYLYMHIYMQSGLWGLKEQICIHPCKGSYLIATVPRS